MSEYPKVPRACDDVPDDKSQYHNRMSQIFRRAKIISVLSLVIFVLLMIGMFGNSITYQNLRYLLRDLDAEYNTSDNSISGANYDSANTMSFSIFGNSIAVATPSYHSLYKLSNARVFSDTLYFSAPVVVSSSKYFIVYDLGGYTFTVYNSLGELYTETLQYGIRDVCISDSGFFAIVTQSREYRSSVLVYNSKFERVGKYENDRYVQRVEISDDGEYMFFASFYALSGEYITVSSLYPIGSTQAAFNATSRGRLPLDCGFIDGDRIALVCSDCVLIYSKNGDTVGSYSYDSSLLVRAAIGKSTVCLLLDSGAVYDEYVAEVIDSTGKEVYNYKVQDKVYGCDFYDDYLFVLTSNKLLRITGGGVLACDVSSAADSKKMLPYSEDCAVIAYSDHADVVRVE